MATLETLVGNVIKIAVGVRVVQRAMLGEPLYMIGTLPLMEAGHIAKVSAADDFAVLVEIKAPGIPPTFAK